MSEIRVKNRKVFLKKQNREIYIDTYNWTGNDYLINLRTPKKSTIYKIEKKELYYLSQLYRRIKADVEVFHLRTRFDKNILGKLPQPNEDENMTSDSEGIDEVDNEISDVSYESIKMELL